MLIARALKKTLSLEAVPVADAAELDSIQANVMIDAGPVEAADAEEILHKLAGATTSLEELQDMLLGALRDGGGIGKNAALATGIALEHICASIDLMPPVINVSLEDFDINQPGADSKTKVAPTELVLEAVTETLKKVWAVLVEFVGKTIAWLRDFAHRQLDQLSKLHAQADKVLEFSKTKQILQPFDITNERLQKALYTEGKTVEEIVRSFEATIAQLLAGFMPDHQQQTAKNVDAAFKAMRADGSELRYREILGSTMAVVGAYASDVFKNGKNPHAPQALPDCDVFATQPLLGGFGFYYMCPREAAALNSLRVATFHVEGAYTEPLPSLSRHEIQQVAQILKGAAQTHEAFRETFVQLDRFHKELDEHAKAKAQQLANEDRGRISLISPLVRALIKVMVGTSAAGVPQIVKVCRDMLHYVQLSVDKNPA